MAFFKLPSVKLTNRELEIMNIFWESDSPLVASEIARRGNRLTINTVQAVLKKLVASNFIQIEGIVYSGTVLCRSYRPTLTSDEYEVNRMLDSFHRISSRATGLSLFVDTVLKDEEDPVQLQSEIREMEKVLKAGKKACRQE